MPRRRTTTVSRRTDENVPLVKELRIAKGWTQGDLARRAGVSRATIASLESGRRGGHPKTLQDVAGALGVEIQDLFKVVALDGDQPPPRLFS